MRTGTVLLVFFLTGCVATKSEPVKMHRPVLLDTVAFPVDPGDLYDEAFALAFEQGYQVAYSSQEEGMMVIELPSPTGLLDIGTAWVQRVDLLVRDVEARGVLYIRYYSYDPEEGDIRVVDADRQAAAAFLSTLKQRLMPASRP